MTTYRVVHLKDYNPEIDRYEVEERESFDAPCDEIACCIFGKVILGRFNTADMIRGEGPFVNRLCAMEVNINGKTEYFALYKPYQGRKEQ